MNTKAHHKVREEADAENAHRTVFAACLPAARLAAALKLDGRMLKGWVELAFFQEFKNTGMSLVEIAETLGISERKAQQLNRRLRENFMVAHKSQELLRRIEFILWSGPHTLARLNQTIHDYDLDDIEAALQTLQAEERVVKKRHGKVDDASPHLRGVVFEATQKRHRQTGASVASRIDGMRTFCASIANTIYSRFFGSQELAFARTVGFRIRADRVHDLEAEYSAFFERLAALEDEAKNDPSSIALDLSICWAPYGEAQKAVAERRKEEE